MESTPSWAEILEWVAAGDPEALGRLYEAHAEGVYALAYRLSGSRPDAEDVVQEVFLGLPKAVGSYRAHGRFDSWLLKLTTRTALQAHRRRRRRREVRLTRAVSLPDGRNPESALDGIDLERALAALPEELRSVFVLKRIEGLSHAEIAATLGLTNACCRKRLSRATKRLRARPRTGRASPIQSPSSP